MPNNEEAWQEVVEKGMSELSPDIVFEKMEEDYKWLIRQRKNIWQDNKKGTSDGKKEK